MHATVRFTKPLKPQQGWHRGRRATCTCAARLPAACLCPTQQVAGQIGRSAQENSYCTARAGYSYLLHPIFSHRPAWQLLVTPAPKNVEKLFHHTTAHDVHSSVLLLRHSLRSQPSSHAASFRASFTRQSDPLASATLAPQPPAPCRGAPYIKSACIRKPPRILRPSQHPHPDVPATTPNPAPPPCHPRTRRRRYAGATTCFCGSSRARRRAGRARCRSPRRR